MNVFDHKEVEVMSLLIAEPFMKDPNFARSVVLLVEVNEGVVGFVLSESFKRYTISSLVEGWSGDNFDIQIGGPVERNSLHFIHKYADLEGAIPLSKDLWWGGDFEQLKEWNKLGKLDSNSIKFFLGYAGWTAEQLQEELEQKRWRVLPLSIDIFSVKSSDLWQKILIQKGGEYKQIAKYPIDPQLN